MSEAGEAVVAAPRSADTARVAAAGALCRQTTTSRPGTTAAPPVFQGSLAACVSSAACAVTRVLRIEGAPVVAWEEAVSVVARRVVRARQTAIRARNGISLHERRPETLRCGSGRRGAPSRTTVREG